MDALGESRVLSAAHSNAAVHFMCTYCLQFMCALYTPCQVAVEGANKP